MFVPGGPNKRGTLRSTKVAEGPKTYYFNKVGPSFPDHLIGVLAKNILFLTFENSAKYAKKFIRYQESHSHKPRVSEIRCLLNCPEKHIIHSVKRGATD
jgi:hypothetical protein